MFVVVVVVPAVFVLAIKELSPESVNGLIGASGFVCRGGVIPLHQLSVPPLFVHQFVAHTFPPRLFAIPAIVLLFAADLLFGS